MGDSVHAVPHLSVNQSVRERRASHFVPTNSILGVRKMEGSKKWEDGVRQFSFKSKNELGGLIDPIAVPGSGENSSRREESDKPSNRSEKTKDSNEKKKK